MLRWILLVTIVLAVPLSILLVLVYRAENAMEQLVNQPEIVLQASQELIKNRLLYRNDHPGWTPAYSKSDVILNPRQAPFETNIPEVFRLGRIAYIVIHTNAVTICVSAFPRRYLLAFGSTAEQHGDERIIDRLWLSYGVHPVDGSRY